MTLGRIYYSILLAVRKTVNRRVCVCVCVCAYMRAQIENKKREAEGRGKEKNLKGERYGKLVSRIIIFLYIFVIYYGFLFSKVAV